MKGGHYGTHFSMPHQPLGTVHTPSNAFFGVPKIVETLPLLAVLDDLGGKLLHGLGVLEGSPTACLPWIGRVLHQMLCACANVLGQLIDRVKLAVVFPHILA